jgi:hypothetical protein
MNKEININGEDYILKSELEDIRNKLEILQKSLIESKREPCKRFGMNQEYKLTRLFNTIFSDTTNSVNEDYAIKNGIIVIDPANVLMCSAISEEAKRFLCKYQDFESESRKEPELDYNTKRDGEIKSRFSTEYLSKILPILFFNSEALDICINKDYPITLSNKHFKFILAPRIESE